MLAHKAVHAQREEPGQARPKIGDIFRQFGPEYRQHHSVTLAQYQVMRAIEICRTSALGGHLRMCEDCGVIVEEFNSCRNRHCPNCQALAQYKWVAGREQRILPVRYFHVVFTVPAELRAVLRLNRKHGFALLMRAAAQTLLELGRDPKRLGAQLGITAVLHTWTRELQFHPHVHCVVTAGGLATEGSSRWIHISGDFLFPVRVLSKLFRGKFLAGLQELYDAGKLILPLRDADSNRDVVFQKLKDKLYAMEWNVYSKAPFNGVQSVFSYLGRYTHRIAISNQRLISFDDDGVCFATKDGATTTLTPDEFIRRFLMHVLPHGFVKIRHYGLLAPGNVNTRLEVARKLLAPSEIVDEPAIVEANWEEVLLRLTGIDLRICRSCGSSRIRRYSLPRSRAPPGTP